MEKTRLGRTDLWVSRTAFGALPIQRTEMAIAKRILWKAYDHGINFFDTARMYSDSEEKIGEALSSIRHKIIIASKTHAETATELKEHLALSLKNLKTDYIDLLQFHTPTVLPNPEEENGLYQAALKAKKEGKVRHIGMTNHRLDLANTAVDSGLYETMQYPLSLISSSDELKIIDRCRKSDTGLIAMKALCGGLTSNVKAAFAFLRQYQNVVPIWGIQHEWELDQFIEMEKDPPVLDGELLAAIDQYKKDLSEEFCRACGYCLPCPEEIPIPMAARMSLLLRRAVFQKFITDEWREKMNRINSCTECYECHAKCPYDLDTPQLLKKMLKDYNEFIKNH